MENNTNENNVPFYEETNDTQRRPYAKREFNAKNYLNTRLSDGEKKRDVKIRILPATPNTQKIYVPIHIHSMKLDPQIAQSGFKSFVCLNDKHLEEHDERGCPFCNKAKGLFAEANKCDQSERLKKSALCKEAYKYEPKTCYIVRVIERGKESEGVKFWRFNHWDNGKGCLDQLRNLYELRNKEALEANFVNQYTDIITGEWKEEAGYNIFNLTNGKDIILTLSKGENTDKTEISIMESGMQTPLSNDPEQAIAWVNDPKGWHDMYATKTYEYLDVVVNGGIPVFDKEKGVFVDKNKKDAIDKKVGEEIKQELKDAGQVRTLDTNISAPIDDLPF